MHGDIALAEAQGSLEAFFHLVGLGVPFPHDRYGAYVGYKTDHDPRQRATSAGPLTSKLMFEALAAEVRRRRIRVFDRHEAVALLTAGRGAAKRTIGALALDTRKPGRSGPRLRPLQRRERRSPRPAARRDVRALGLSRKPDGLARDPLRGRRRGPQPDRIPVRPGFGEVPLERLRHLSAGRAALCLHGRARRRRAGVPQRLFPRHGGAGDGRFPQGLPVAVRSAQDRRRRLVAHRPSRLRGDRGQGPPRLSRFPQRPPRRRPARAVRAVAARARGPRLSRAIGRPDGDADRPAQEDERARPSSSTSPTASTSPASRSRSPSAPSTTTAASAARSGGNRTCAACSRSASSAAPTASPGPAARRSTPVRSEAPGPRSSSPAGARDALSPRPNSSARRGISFARSGTWPHPCSAAGRRRHGAGGLHRRGAAEDVRLRRGRQGPGDGPRRKGPGPGAVAEGASRAARRFRARTASRLQGPRPRPDPRRLSRSDRRIPRARREKPGLLSRPRRVRQTAAPAPRQPLGLLAGRCRGLRCRPASWRSGWTAADASARAGSPSAPCRGPRAGSRPSGTISARTGSSSRRNELGQESTRLRARRGRHRRRPGHRPGDRPGPGPGRLRCRRHRPRLRAGEQNQGTLRGQGEGPGARRQVPARRGRHLPDRGPRPDARRGRRGVRPDRRPGQQRRRRSAGAPGHPRDLGPELRPAHVDKRPGPVLPDPERREEDGRAEAAARRHQAGHRLHHLRIGFRVFRRRGPNTAYPKRP